MAYHSIAEIYDSIDGTRERVYQSVEGLSDEQGRFRPTPEAWSVAEIVEHLSLIERQMMQLFIGMTKKAEDGGLLRGDAQEFAPVSLEEFAERARGEKYQAPETMRPTGSASISDSLEGLRQTRAAIRELQPRLEKIDGTALHYPHPAFGPLNLYQWLAFIGAHEERHLRQLKAVKRSPDFGANVAAESN
ncbi:MAG: DinB family protein [Pyrinomonadaceae bacterium]